MHRLEITVPPVAVAVLIAIAMWCVSSFGPSLALPVLVRLSITGALVAAGAGICVAAVVSFRRANTTVNPTRPEATSALVTSGIYRFSRNPMYLGFLLILIGWAAFLSSVPALTGAPLFVLYMNRFQVRPEEKAMSSIFGEEYEAYKTEVRRWL
jgi:protein-S-isoprenylcysteine O-methyltransferase Ste14